MTQTTLFETVRDEWICGCLCMEDTSGRIYWQFCKIDYCPHWEEEE